MLDCNYKKKTIPWWNSKPHDELWKASTTHFPGSIHDRDQPGSGRRAKGSGTRWPLCKAARMSCGSLCAFGEFCGLNSWIIYIIQWVRAGTCSNRVPPIVGMSCKVSHKPILGVTVYIVIYYFGMANKTWEKLYQDMLRSIFQIGVWLVLGALRFVHIPSYQVSWNSYHFINRKTFLGTFIYLILTDWVVMFFHVFFALSATCCFYPPKLVWGFLKTTTSPVTVSQNHTVQYRSKNKHNNLRG